jgi:hypothetical protein
MQMMGRQRQQPQTQQTQQQQQRSAVQMGDLQNILAGMGLPMSTASVQQQRQAPEQQGYPIDSIPLLFYRLFFQISIYLKY